MKIIMLGAPGAGKGTQAKMIAEKCSIPHISTGDIFRANLKEGTPLGKKAKEYMDQGLLVPDALTCDLVVDRISKDDCEGGYILDGFPRTVPQAEALDTFAVIDYVIDIDVADQVLVDRLSGRRVCVKCGATYHTSMLNGATKCSVCGDELIQRNDDKAETVLARLSVYHDQTAPLIGYYEAKGLLKKIDGAQGLENTTQAILNALGANA